MNLVSRLMLVLGIVVAGATLAACHKSEQAAEVAPEAAPAEAAPAPAEAAPADSSSTTESTTTTTTTTETTPAPAEAPKQ